CARPWDIGGMDYW
nr:immunoglobulin heavy chain junction region [Mus musculus]